MYVQNQEKISYDNIHDVLYIFLGPPKYSYEDEIYPGIFLRKDDETDEVIGAIIMDYSHIEKNIIIKNIPFYIDVETINKNYII